MAKAGRSGDSSRTVRKRIEAAASGKVKVAITDIDGILRGKYINKDKLAAALDGGFGFCNVIFGWDAADVCYDDAAYTGWHSGYPDAHARLDLDSYREVPWDRNVPFMLGEFVDEAGAPLPICPRQVLKRVLARAAAAGLHPFTSLEYEFFHFRETSQSLADKGFVAPTPLSPGMFGYSLLRLGQSRDYVNALFDEMAAFGVPIEGLHTETGPGVMEAALLYCEALESADRAVLFKSGAKEIGHRFGILPSFMAKWNADLPGCSGHIHQSLWDAAGKKNLFHDERAPTKMSALFESYVAGQMRALPELLPLYAPTINSYKRLVEGAWAPTKVNWAIDNRTTALRVIQGGPKSTRLETRVGGSDANPYLALAAAIGSGLWGIEQKLKLEAAPVKGSGYADTKAPVLPRNLAEATERFDGSAIARELFGDAFVDHFATSRRWEWRQYGKAVTDWERKRYFEII
ncbi:MAG TPA: glutamine synthetase family protein [Polyangia bacterium]|jgi:glutamine synthetase